MKIQGFSEPFKVGKLNFDPVITSVCIGLILIGYIMVTSSSLHLGSKLADETFHYPFRQLIHIAIGLVCAAGLINIPLRFWEKTGPELFLFGLLLLVIVLIPGLGVKVKGSVRWVSLGGLRIQVSEVVKWLSVVYIAGYVTRHEQDLRTSAYGLLKPLGMFSIACFLLLLEPDFGSSVVILTIALGVMFLAGARIWQFGLLLSVCLLMAALLVIFSPYRLKRVISFLDPWADPLDSGFQLVQALISYGRGDLFGVGLGNGLQKLFYLPEAHTDFLFSVIAEELGLMGVLIVISLFTIFLWRAFEIGKLAEEAGNKFSAYIAYGIGIWFGFQSFINIGVNMGMLPTKGLTLPLMSYGGGSMIIMCCAVALLLRVYSEAYELRAGQPKRKSVWQNA